jgi:hypothetical protein
LNILSLDLGAGYLDVLPSWKFTSLYTYVPFVIVGHN